MFHFTCPLLYVSWNGILQAGGQDKPKIPDLETFLEKRDYQGSVALLQFKRHANRHDVRNLEWLAYCHFHYGEHDKVWDVGGLCLHVSTPCHCLCQNNYTGCCILRRLQALTIYKELLSFEDPDPLYYVYAAACYYYMGLYKEAETTAQQVGQAACDAVKPIVHGMQAQACSQALSVSVAYHCHGVAVVMSTVLGTTTEGTP